MRTRESATEQAVRQREANPHSHRITHRGEDEEKKEENATKRAVNVSIAAASILA